MAVAAAKPVDAGAVITDSAPDAAATAATPGSSPHTTIVSASTRAVCSSMPARVRRR